MRTSYEVILAVLLVLLSACAQKVNDPADVQAIRTSMDDFAKAVNAGDADGVAAVMTDRIIFADLNIPVLVGKEAIRSSYRGVFSQAKADFSTPVEDVRVVGDLAVARGTWTDKSTPRAEGIASSTNSGSWMVVFARQNEGSWKWDWCVPNSNQPLPGSTPSGEDEQALFQIERDCSVAYVNNDWAAIDKFLAAEHANNVDGTIYTKKQTLANMRSGAYKVEAATTSEMKVLILGETGIVHGLWTEKSTNNGKDTSGTYRYTDIFQKRKGSWQCVGGYGSKVQ